MLIYLPNLWWNWSHGFVSYLHLRDNAELSGRLLHPTAFLEFLGSQFGVIGPLFFAALIAIVARPRALSRTARPAACRLRLAAAGADARDQPVVAGRAELGGARLCLGDRAGGGLGARARLAALGAGVDRAQPGGGGHSLRHATGALAAIGVAVPAKYDPLHRLRGWRELGQSVAAIMAAHPGLTLLADDRELLAALIYYVHPHPFGAVEWNPVPGITDQWRLTNNIGDHRGEDFLAVTVHGLVDEMRPDFAELTPLATIRTHSGPGGGTVYTVYLARGFRGSGRRHR